MSAHTVPQYAQATRRAPFFSIEGPDGAYPLTTDARLDPAERLVETFTDGWFCRLSAPGYLDCTEWEGPFASEDEARLMVQDTWGVDPDTGEDLPDDGSDAEAEGLS